MFVLSKYFNNCKLNDIVILGFLGVGGIGFTSCASQLGNIIKSPSLIGGLYLAQYFSAFKITECDRYVTKGSKKLSGAWLWGSYAKKWTQEKWVGSLKSPTCVCASCHSPLS